MDEKLKKLHETKEGLSHEGIVVEESKGSFFSYSLLSTTIFPSKPLLFSVSKSLLTCQDVNSRVAKSDRTEGCPPKET